MIYVSGYAHMPKCVRLPSYSFNNNLYKIFSYWVDILDNWRVITTIAIIRQRHRKIPPIIKMKIECPTIYLYTTLKL